MKKNFVRLFVLALALICLLTFGACGRKLTVADYVASDEFQSQMTTMKDSLSGTGMDIEVSAEGNRLTYTFTYGDLSGQDEDAIADALESGLDSQASTFESVASQLKTTVKANDVSVVVEYLTAEGKVLASREFFPEE